MATLFLYRVTLTMPAVAVVPEGSASELAAWANAQLGPDTVTPDLGPPLSPTGEEPVTHHWTSIAWAEEDCRSMLGHLADLGGIERPSRPTWDGWTMEEKCGWANGTLHPAMEANASGGVLMEDNTGNWHPQQLLIDMGLRPVYLEPPEEEPVLQKIPAKPRGRRKFLARVRGEED